MLADLSENGPTAGKYVGVTTAPDDHLFRLDFPSARIEIEQAPLFLVRTTLAFAAVTSMCLSKILVPVKVAAELSLIQVEFAADLPIGSLES